MASMSCNCFTRSQVHLQCTADAAVLQGHQRVILLAYHPTLLDEVGINIHLAYIIHDDRKLYTLLILQDTVQKCCLSAA